MPTNILCRKSSEQRKRNQPGPQRTPVENQTATSL
jgi:hypothetical protein